MKLIVVYHRNQSKFETKLKEFDTETAAEKFIQDKVKSGMTCHLYNHNSTFTLNQQVVKTS